MGMPITIEVVGADYDDLKRVFAYFRQVDARYSTYKSDSEISRINRGLPASEWGAEMKHVLALCDETMRQTHGYFDINKQGRLDPSGLVKGWAIQRAAKVLRGHGYQHFYIEAGGDIQTFGDSAAGTPWRVGIRNPFDTSQVVKVVALQGEAIATSGTYIRGEHIYNPLADFQPPAGIASLSVIGPNIYDADRFATAAFAMGRKGIAFIASLPGLEGYMIDITGMATFTSGFERYVYAAKA